MTDVSRILIVFVSIPMVLESSPAASSILFYQKILSIRELVSHEAEAVISRVQREAPLLFSGTVELARRQGLDIESHSVVTEDGYVLTVHRLRAGNGSAGIHGDKRPPVLMVHGFVSASHLWVLTPRHHALAYLLWDHGYDVWLANLRGNSYSREHVRLSTTDPAFWKFSWHEMGYYDLPAMIDYILHMTAHRKVFYVGHSMGNTVYYVMTSSRPEYNDKIRLHVALAPAVFMSTRRVPIMQFVLQQGSTIINALEQDHVVELLPSSPARISALYLACSGGSAQLHLCRKAYDFFYGPANPGINTSLIPHFVAHVTEGSSVRTLSHFVQNILSPGHFRKYNEGWADANIKRYGSSNPPDYDLSLVTAPSALWFSDEDQVVYSEDVTRLGREQKRVVQFTRIPDRPYNHMDFIFAPSASNIIYEPVLKLFKQDERHAK